MAEVGSKQSSPYPSLLLQMLIQETGWRREDYRMRGRREPHDHPVHLGRKRKRWVWVPDNCPVVTMPLSKLLRFQSHTSGKAQGAGVDICIVFRRLQTCQRLYFCSIFKLASAVGNVSSKTVQTISLHSPL